MKNGMYYENKMGSIIRITSIKNNMVHITYNGKKKTPIKVEDFQDMIDRGCIYEIWDERRKNTKRYRRIYKSKKWIY